MYKESRDNWAKMIDVDGGKLGSDRDARGVSVGDERECSRGSPNSQEGLESHCVNEE